MKRNNKWKSDTEFVVVKLAKEDKPKFEAWAKENSKKIFGFLRELGEGGYKLSISPDFNNACVIFSITGTDNSVSNVKCCMTSRAEDVEEAILLGCYKHFVMAEGDSWLDIAEERTDNWG